MLDMKVGILGGGLTGLTMGNLLNCSFEVLEKESECGGLCRTLQDQGFTFDYGGCHILFSKDDDALRFLLNALRDNKSKNRRNNKVLYKDHYIKYPFENGLHDLPLEDNYECLYHFVQNLIARGKGEINSPENFKEWCTFTFGRGIADKYLIPYNQKIWKFDPGDMSAHWVEGRVPQPPAEDVIKSSLGIETEGYTHQLYYYYPIIGGIQAVISALEVPISSRVTTGFEVTTLARDGHGWQVSDGKITKSFDRLVSTIPIFDLVAALEGVPAMVQNAVQQLKYNRLITVLIGINTPNLSDLTALYIPDRQILPHRLGFPSSFSPRCAPHGKASILAEITCPSDGDEIWNTSDRAIADRVVGDIVKLGIVGNKSDICYTKVMRSQYAYVIYDLDYLRNIRIIREFFKSLDITLLGRFSEFEYLNMDACVRRAMTIAEELNRDDGCD